MAIVCLFKQPKITTISNPFLIDGLVHLDSK